MKLVTFLFLLAFTYVQADTGCLSSQDGVIVPISSTEVEASSACTTDAFFVEKKVDGGIPDVSEGGFTLQSEEYKTYLAPIGNQVILQTAPFVWQRTANTEISGNLYFVIDDAFKKSYLAVCSNEVFMTAAADKCETFGFVGPRK